MDPDTALRELRAAVATFWTSEDQGALDNAAEAAILAADALDEWLTKGGHLPAAWQAVPRAATPATTPAAATGGRS